MLDKWFQVWYYIATTEEKEALMMRDYEYEREMELIEELGTEKFSIKSILKAVELLSLVRWLPKGFCC